MAVTIGRSAPNYFAKFSGCLFQRDSRNLDLGPCRRPPHPRVGERYLGVHQLSERGYLTFITLLYLAERLLCVSDGLGCHFKPLLRILELQPGATHAQLDVQQHSLLARAEFPEAGLGPAHTKFLFR